MNGPLCVLLTGVGSPAAPGVIKSLRLVKDMHFRIVGIDIRADVAGSSLVDRFLIGPRADDPSFAEKVLELCKSEGVQVILPLVTKELLPFARNKRLFHQHGITVSVSDEAPIGCAVDKGRLFEKLRSWGIDVPEFRVAETERELFSALEDLRYPVRPVCFKPTEGDGGRGFRIVDAGRERLNSLFKEKPDSTFISLNELREIVQPGVPIPKLVVMEYLPNEEYSVDILADRGKVIAVVARSREATSAGITVKGTVVKEDDVMAYAASIVRLLKLHGNVGIQVRRDRCSRPRILEINPRIQGTIVHCTASGVNLPHLAVKLALGMPIDPSETEVHWGTQMIRTWQEFYSGPDGQVFTL